MPTVKDIIVRKPTDEEITECKTWTIWTCGPGDFDWEYTQAETCLILEGKITVKDDNDSISFGAGDLVIFPVDLICTWQVEESVKKHYNFE